MNYVTLFLAIVVAFITIQQFLLSRERFKLDLFDRRFLIFKATQTFINNVINLNKKNVEDSSTWFAQFQKDAHAAIFLFDEPVYEFLQEILLKGQRVATSKILRNEPEAVGPETTEIHKEAALIQQEMFDLQRKVTVKFSPYLKFSKWKYGFILDVVEIPKDSCSS